MTVEITISQVTAKMQKLLARNEFMYLPELRTRVDRSITSLEKSLKFLKDLNDGQGNTLKTNRWKTELRKAVYDTENDIDSFRARTALAKASPILYVMSLSSLSDQFFLNNMMEKIVCKLEKMSQEIPEISGKSDNKGDSQLEQSAFEAVGEDTSEPYVSDGQSDQEQAKLSADKGASSCNNLGDLKLQQSAKSKTFGEDTSQPIISNGRPESDQEQAKLPEDTIDLSTNNLGQLVIKDVGPNMSDGRPHQEKTTLPPTDSGDAELESREDVEYTSQQKGKSEIKEEVEDTVGQVVSDRNSMTSSRLRRAASILGDETKNPPGKPCLQHSETLSLYDETKSVRVEDKLQELSQLTLNRYAMYFLISVVGRAGSGKTFLVRQIFNLPQTKQNFEKLAFISVSQNIKEREILAEILQQVAGVKDQEKLSFEVLQQKLRDFLARKRYLIVLDDVHSPDVWKKIKLAFPNSLGGSRVILTIRDANVARCIAPTIVLLHLRPLTDVESWKLFSTRVKTEGTLPDSIKQEILRKCQGLPLDILVLGGVLAPKKFAEWSKVLNHIKETGKEEKKRVRETKPRREETVNVQSPKRGEIQAEEVIEDEKIGRKETMTAQSPKHGEIQSAKMIELVKQKETNAAHDEDQSNSPVQSVYEDSLDPLDLAIQDLSSPLRECLHYMCLFPKSRNMRDIHTRRLFRLWFAEGLAGDTNAAEVVEKHIEDLVQRNMIEVVEPRSDGKPKTCNVVSAVYDKFIADAAGLGYHRIHGNSDSTPKSQNPNIRRLAELLDPQDNPQDKHYLNRLCIKDVRSYICFYKQKGDRPAEEVEKFIKNTFNERGFGLLTMLDLEGVYKPVLPKTLGKVLPLLKYLGLRWTFLDSIPESVGDLQFLETLDVKHTNITTLPISLWKTKNLQHLYMNEIPFKMSNREPSSCDYPTELQTLWGLLIGNKDPPIDWLNKLTHVRKLGLTCHTDSLEGLTKWISGLTGLRSLRLRAINAFIKPSEIRHLGSMKDHKELTDLYLLGKLPRAIDKDELPPKLTNLTLSVSQLSDDPMKMLGKLKELKVLKLLAGTYIGKDMTCLQGEFPELEVLKLWMLKELEKWIIQQGTMPKLKKLEIRNCQNLKKPEGLENLPAAFEEVTLTNMDEDFMAEVEGCLGQNKVIKNKHDFYPSWN